ncbi:MAG: ATP-binding cassette domain-containing protein, partial [Candidatus Dadabacteria bacterium]
ILGPSGTGKTVFLKLILGLLRADKGRITVFNKDITNLREEELYFIRRKIGMLFQGAALFDSLTVFENVAYPLLVAGERDENKIREVVLHNLEVVGLLGTENKLPAELSGGQKKRVGLARALSSEPEVILFDEPTTGLDPTATKNISNLIIRLHKEMGMTSLVVTHDIETAKKVSNRWILLSSGNIVADGEPSYLLQYSEDVKKFVEGNWTE